MILEMSNKGKCKEKMLLISKEMSKQYILWKYTQARGMQGWEDGWGGDEKWFSGAVNQTKSSVSMSFFRIKKPLQNAMV